jgi:hypothetical protein
MRCVECDSEKSEGERGWVTVLSPSGSRRIHYCPDCMAELCSRSTAADEVDDHPSDD